MKRIVFLIFVVLMISGVRETSAQDMALKTNVLYDVTTTINLGYEVALGRKTTLDIWANYNPWVLGHKWVGIKGAGTQFTEEREKKFKQLLVQPELRYWFCEKFNGHFIGFHLHGGIFNVGALNLPFDWGRYKDVNGNYLGTYPVNMSISGSSTTAKGIEYPYGTSPYPGLIREAGQQEAVNQQMYSYADRDGVYTNSFEGWLVGAGVSYGYHWVLSPRFSLEFTLGVGFAYLDYEKSRCTNCKQVLGDENSWYFGPTRAGLSLVYMIK